MATCRIILCANSIAQVIPAIRSRCLAIRVPAPTHKDITSILKVNSNNIKRNVEFIIVVVILSYFLKIKILLYLRILREIS